MGQPRSFFLLYNRLMNQDQIEWALADLPLGEIYYYPRLDSTNLQASRMNPSDLPDFSAIVADEQTAGRGRQERTWVTRPGTSLALSVIIHPQSPPGDVSQHLGCYSGLGALAMTAAVNQLHGLSARVKWPNDILLTGKKVGGVLVELNWQGKELKEVILGVGLNVKKGAIPEGAEFRFPPGTVEEAVGTPVERLPLMTAFLEQLLAFHRELPGKAFVRSWERSLAYQGQMVSLSVDDRQIASGIQQGLDDDGSLLLKTASGEVRVFQVGEIQLRPVDRS